LSGFTTLSALRIAMRGNATKVATPTVSRKARSTDGSPSALVRKSA